MVSNYTGSSWSKVGRSEMILPQKKITIIFALMLMISSASAWSYSAHFISPESTNVDYKHQKEGPITFHASWWDKISEPWKKGQVDERKASNDNDNDGGLLTEELKEPPPSFFVRPALIADMGPASKILADGFFKDNTNFITYQFERLETYLSMEVGFPKPNTRHKVFVACEENTGKVLGVAEVDARACRATFEDGPYLCNLAVDLNHLRRGIATALVKKCEAEVQEWVRDECLEADIRKETGDDSDDDSAARLSSSLHLKVRQRNEKAIQMYQKLGYDSILFQTDKKNEKVLVMRKQLEHMEKKEVETTR